MTWDTVIDEVFEPKTPKTNIGSFDNLIASASTKYGVDPDYIKATIKSESDFNPKAVSKAGAKGLMQLMDTTAGELGVKDPFDPEQNIMGGTKYLAQNLKKYDGDPLKASAAYNAGPGNVDKAIKQYGDKWLENLDKVTGKYAKETQQYLENISKHYNGNRQTGLTRSKPSRLPITQIKAFGYSGKREEPVTWDSVIDEMFPPEKESTFLSRIGEKWKTGEAQTELGLLRARQLYGEDTPKIQSRIDQIKQEMPKPGKEKRGLFERAVGAAAEMLPTQIEGMKRGMKRGLTLGAGAAGITALAGQAGPQAAFPEEIITVPSAFAGMYGVGMLSGTLENIGNIEAGLAYDELMDLKDKEGNRLNPSIAKGAAASVGIINGLIEASQINLLLKTIPGGQALLRGAINKTLKKVLAEKTLKNIALKQAGKYGTFIAAETGQEILQETTNIIAAEVAKEYDKELYKSNIPAATRQEIVQRLIDTATQSALAFSVMGFPGAAVSTGAEAMSTKGRIDNITQDIGTKKDTGDPELKEAVSDNIREQKKQAAKEIRDELTKAKLGEGGLLIKNAKESAQAFMRDTAEKLPRGEALTDEEIRQRRIESAEQTFPPGINKRYQVRQPQRPKTVEVPIEPEREIETRKTFEISPEERATETIEAARKRKEKERIAEQRGILQEQAIEAERKLKEASRMGLKLDSEYEKHLHGIIKKAKKVKVPKETKVEKQSEIESLQKEGEPWSMPLGVEMEKPERKEEHARKIREDEAKVSERGVAAGPGEGISREDLQRAGEARAEAGEQKLPQEEKGPEPEVITVGGERLISQQGKWYNAQGKEIPYSQIKKRLEKIESAKERKEKAEPIAEPAKPEKVEGVKPGEVVEAKKPTKREKAITEYNNFVANLTPEQRKQLGDLVVENPKSPSSQLYKIQGALKKAGKQEGVVKAPQPTDWRATYKQVGKVPNDRLDEIIVTAKNPKTGKRQRQITWAAHDEKNLIEWLKSRGVESPEILKKPEAEVKPEAQKVAAKEPWMMTKDEFVTAYEKRSKEFIEWREKAIRSIGRKLGIGKSEAISSDDADAIDKLKDKLGKLQEQQDFMKKVNAAYRKYKKNPKSIESLPDKIQSTVKAFKPAGLKDVPFESFELRNNNANIRRIKQRIEALAKKAKDKTTEIKFDGGTIVDSVEDNRVQIFFDDKPSEEIRTELKQRGFKWAKSIGAWQRMRSSQAMYYAKKITGTEEGKKDTIQFSIKDEPLAQALQPRHHQNIKRLAKRFNTNFPNAPKITVLKDKSELPDFAVRGLQRMGKDPDQIRVRGFHSQGKLWLVASDLIDETEALSTALHETVGHYGVRQILGEEFDGTMLEIYESKQTEIGEIAKQRNFNVSTDKGKIKAADEWLAQEAGRNPQSSWVQRVKAMIIQALRKVFPNIKFSDAEVVQLITRSREYLRGEQGGMGFEFAQSAAYSVKEAAKKITDNPNFRKWFGDSKVVDENGEPLVVYHASDNKFNVFQSGNSAGTIYFGFTEKDAKRAARGKKYVIPVYLKIQNPYGKENPPHWGQAEDSLFVEKLKRQGYDGIYVKDEGGTSLAVFYPTQIKSIFNKGSFDPNKPDISYSAKNKPFSFYKKQDFKPPKEKRHLPEDSLDWADTVTSDLYDDALHSWDDHGRYEFLKRLYNDPQGTVNKLSLYKEDITAHPDDIRNTAKSVEKAIGNLDDEISDFERSNLEFITKQARYKYVNDWIVHFYPEVKSYFQDESKAEAIGYYSFEDLISEAHIDTDDTDRLWEDIRKNPKKYADMLGADKRTRFKVVKKAPDIQYSTKKKTSFKRLKDMGLRGRWGKGKDEKTFYLAGDIDPSYKDVLEPLGGEYWYRTSAKGGWREFTFKNAPEGIERQIIDALIGLLEKKLRAQTRVSQRNQKIQQEIIAKKAVKSVGQFVKGGVINAGQFFKKTNIQLPTNDPDDVRKGIRWVQTMQDLARNYPKAKKAFDVEIKRVSNTNQMSVHDRETTDAYFTLTPEAKKLVNQTLIAGDIDGEVFDEETLKSRFKLSDSEIKGYESVREALDEKMDILIEQMLSDVVDEGESVTPEMVKAVKESKSFEELRAKLVHEGVDQRKAEWVNWIIDWVKERKGYVPHKWKSEWVVKATAPEGGEWMLEVPSIGGKVLPTKQARQKAANIAAVQVLKEKFGWDEGQIEKLIQKGDIRLIRTRDLPVELFQGARMDVVASIVESATDKAWAEYEKGMTPEQLYQIKDLREKIKAHTEELYLAKGWGRHLIGRKGVMGYREDMENVLAEYLYGFNAFTAKGEAAREFAKVMKDINPTKTPVLWQHVREFVGDMLGATSEAGIFKKTAGLYFLAGDVSAATLNMTQNWTHAVPMLRAIKPKEDKIAAEKEIYRAMRDVAKEYATARKEGRKVFSSASDSVSQGEINALKQAYDMGHLDPAFMGELTGFRPNKIWQSYGQKIWDGLFKMFTGAEAWNRTSTFLAAYRRAVRAGIENPIDKAVEVVQASHFVYGRGNRPQIVRKTGALGNIAFTFMTYPLNNLVFLKHRVQDILDAAHKGDKQAVKDGMRVAGSNLAYVFAFGGMLGLPFSWLGTMIWNLFNDDEDDWEVLMRKYLPKTAGRTITRGIPAALLGNDMSWRIEGTDVFGLPVGFQIATMAKKRAEKAHKLWGQGEYLDAVFHLTPDMIRNPYRAVVGFAEGGERTGVPPIKYTAYEALTKGLGFTPTREAETYKAGEVTRKARQFRLDNLENFAERYLIARKKKDKDAVIELREDLREYNQRQKKKGQKSLRISWKDVTKSAKTRRRSRRKGYREHVPKYMRRYQRRVETTLNL